MPRFRAPLGGVAGQRAQMSNDPRFVPPLVIGEQHTAELSKLKQTIKGLRDEFKRLSESKDSAISKFRDLSTKLQSTLGPDWPSKIPELKGYKKAYETIIKLNGDIEKLNKEVLQSKSDDVLNKQGIAQLTNEMLALQTELIQRRLMLSTLASDPEIQAIIDAVTRAMAVGGADTPDAIRGALGSVIDSYEAQKQARSLAVQQAQQQAAIVTQQAQQAVAEAQAAAQAAQAQAQAQAQTQAQTQALLDEYAKRRYDDSVQDAKLEANVYADQEITNQILNQNSGRPLTAEQQNYVEEQRVLKFEEIMRIEGQKFDDMNGQTLRDRTGVEPQNVRLKLDLPERWDSEASVLPVKKYKSKLNMSTLHKLGRLKI